jgi:chromosome segregation ATPase
MSELVKQEHKDLPAQLDKLISHSDTFTKIATRAADPNETPGELKTFTERKLQNIADFMPVINEKINAFGRQNSFHTNKLMTLQMLSKGSTMRVLRQCLSQIERKRSAVKDSMQNLKKKKIESEELLYKIERITEDISILESEINQLKSSSVYIENKNDPEINTEIRKKEREIIELNFEKQYKEIELEDLHSSTADTRVYLEGAFKEIANFQEAYKQICKNKEIPDS